MIGAFERVTVDMWAERVRQVAKWGPQSHPDGTGYPGSVENANRAKLLTDTAAREGELTWGLIFLEEVAEAMAESAPALLRAELVQALAVGAAWIADIDSR